MPSVLDLLKQRSQSASRPGRRTDPHRVVLAIEGGGSRAAYPAGMALALDELGLLPAFDAVYGVSAGAITGSWFVSGEAARGLPQWPRMTRAVCDLRRMVAGRPVIDTEAVMDAFEAISPGVITRMTHSEVPLHPIATCTRTGRAVDLRPYVHDAATFRSAVRASAAIPFLSGRPIELGGRRWVDGGLAENVPFRTALAEGATHVVVLRSLLADESLRPPTWKEHAAVASYLTRHSRPAFRAWLARHQISLADNDAISEHPHTLEIRAPRTSHPITRLERDAERLQRALYVGRSAAYTALAGLTSGGLERPRRQNRQPAN